MVIRFNLILSTLAVLYQVKEKFKVFKKIIYIHILCIYIYLMQKFTNKEHFSGGYIIIKYKKISEESEDQGK